MSLEVIKKAVFSTIQDGGRPGYGRYGVPVSGMMDDHSGRLANWLAGNSSMHPLIEISIAGGEYRFHEDSVIGITGASALCRLNGKEIQMYKSKPVKAGDQLSIGRLTMGRFLYLAINGLEIPGKIMGSCSTYLPAAFGGIDGRILNAGDRISYGTGHNADDKSVPGKLIPHFGSKRKLRVTEGPEWDLLDQDQQKKILTGSFNTDSRSNRMGIRLKGKGMGDINSIEMISSPVIPGIIQYSGEGNFIILHRDAQTIGGYPRFLKVIDADLWRAAQCTPDSEVSLNMVSIEEAVEYSNYMREIRSSATD